MSNARPPQDRIGIRPLHERIGQDEDVVLQVKVETDQKTFTWLIRDAKGTPIAGAEVDRTETATRRELSPQFSVTVTPAHFRFVSRRRRPTFRPGDYQVHLYDKISTLPKSDPPEKRFGSLDLIDESAFSVAAHVREPIKVALVPDVPVDATKQRPHVTYTDFREFLEKNWGAGKPYSAANAWPTYGGGPYETLMNAARDFVSRARVTSFGSLLPMDYIDGKVNAARNQFPEIPVRGASADFLPGVELIWNYWLEEGMLVQTLNVILARFQNRRLPGHDPLARFDVTPLLPLRNRLWGFAEDEQHRLTVRRRAVEYEYEYGISLIGRAVPRPQSVIERRNGFISTFHQAVYLAHRFFKEVDDLTVKADAFPLYRALRDCHIVLSQGTQNQYGEMAVAARAEFLVMQTILAEPQMREFLGGRPMTPYDEPWMDRVDSMKAIQGWTDTSIMHFKDLAEIGEQLVLTIRLGGWAADRVGAEQAGNWARAFRNGIQKYAAAYRTATGVDLAEEPNTEMPSTLLARRLSGTRIRA